MPGNTLYVGRPTFWGNPWTVDRTASCGCRSVGECNHNLMTTSTPQEAVDSYRWWIENGNVRRYRLHELRGKNLACFCRLDQPCHADVLLELANEGG